MPKAKGPIAGAANSIADACPFVGSAKAGIEVLAREDLILDKGADPRKTAYLPPSIRRGIERAERERREIESEAMRKPPPPIPVTRHIH